MLAVVEHEQHRPVVDELLDRSLQREMLALLDIERAGDELDGGVRFAQGGQLDDDDLGEAVGAGVGDRHRQSCLADTSRSGDGDDGTPIELLAQGGDVAGAADELRGLTTRQRYGRDPHRLLDVVVQRRIVGEDPSLQVLGRRREAQAQLVPEHRAEVGAPAQRLGLSAGAVEGQHQLPPELLAERMGGDERFELGDHPGVLAAVHPGVDEVLGHRQPQFLQAQRLAAHARELGELAERGAAPEAEGAFERGMRSGPVAAWASSSNRAASRSTRPMSMA